jgi:hypothetical protein
MVSNKILLDRGGSRLSGKNTRCPEKPPQSKRFGPKVVNDFRKKSFIEQKKILI